MDVRIENAVSKVPIAERNIYTDTINNTAR